MVSSIKKPYTAIAARYAYIESLATRYVASISLPGKMLSLKGMLSACLQGKSKLALKLRCTLIVHPSQRKVKSLEEML